MRVLFVTHFYLPEGTAGVEVYTHTLARALQAVGHEVRVVCATRWGQGSRYWNGAVSDVHEGVAVERLAFNWTLAPRPLDYLYDNPVAAAHCRQLMEEWRPDVVHITSCYTLSASVIEAARALGVPILLQLHDYWFICPRHTLLRWDDTVCADPVTAADCQRCMLGDAKAYRWPRKVVSEAMTLNLIEAIGQVDAATRLPGMRGIVGHFDRRRSYLLASIAECDAVVATSEYLKRRHEMAGVPEGRIEVIRHGSHVTFDAPRRAPSSATLRIGYVGTLSPIKGVHVLIEAFQRLDQGRATLQIHGPLRDDAYTARLRALAAGNPAIEFRGRFERVETLNMLRGMDVLVVPSVWYENSPLVIREAFAAGVPVIISRHGALPEMVREGVDGLLFHPGDADDLARQLRRLLDDPQLLPQLQAGVEPPRPLAAEIDEILDRYRRLTPATLAGPVAPQTTRTLYPSVMAQP